MKLLPLVSSLAVAMLSLSGAVHAVSIAPATLTIKIIGLNDFHGNLQTPGTFGVNSSIAAASRPAVGGAEYLAAYVASLKAKNPLNVVVGAGDFIGASPLISSLFHDEPTIEALNKIGLEFTSVGNHEFDKGTAELKRLQNGGCLLVNGAPDANSCKGFGSGAQGTFDGARFKWLSANVIETATGRPLLPAYGVKTFNGLKVAFIGMTLKATPTIVTPTGVAGLQFMDEASTVNALVPKLRAQGVGAIVVLVHQGGFQSSPTLTDINGCDGGLKNSDGSDSDIGAIVRGLDNAVDLVISAHTHAAYNCSASTVLTKTVSGVTSSTSAPSGLPNSIGRLVPVTSAASYGKLLTDIDMTFNLSTRRVSSVAATNRLVDRTSASINAAIAADPSVKNLVASYNTLVSPLANRVIGTITTAVSSSSSSSGESPAGDLIADAQLQATQPAALGGAMIAFMNGGGIRGSFPAPTAPHDLTYGEAFTIQPFGNSMVTMTLTTQQIKNLLEQQFGGCLGQTGQKIMQVSNGMKISYDTSRAACSKVVNVTFTPTDVTQVPPVVTGAPITLVSYGVVQNPTRTFRVTTNNFMAAGGDGYSVLTGGVNRLGGAQDIDALTNYLSGFKAPNGAYNATAPALGLPRIALFQPLS